jgi:hypothetical protein
MSLYVSCSCVDVTGRGHTSKGGLEVLLLVESISPLLGSHSQLLVLLLLLLLGVQILDVLLLFLHFHGGGLLTAAAAGGRGGSRRGKGGILVATHQQTEDLHDLRVLLSAVQNRAADNHVEERLIKQGVSYFTPSHDIAGQEGQREGGGEIEREKCTWSMA